LWIGLNLGLNFTISKAKEKLCFLHKTENFKQTNPSGKIKIFSAQFYGAAPSQN
jgi:hypothetical protein